MSGARVEEPFPARYHVSVVDAVSGDPFIFGRDDLANVNRFAIEVVSAGGEVWEGVARGPGRTLRRAMTAVVTTPSYTHMCLLASGDAFWVSSEEPAGYRSVDTGGPVVAVRAVASEALLLLASPWKITALGDDGVRWRTDRLAIESLRMDEVQNGLLAGVADPDDVEPRDFVVDLETGRHEGGTPFP